MVQIRMLKMSLKVLLSACMLTFSASVGLSAVYDCKFDKGRTRTSGPQSGLSGPADGRMLIDTETATVYISENNWVGNINGSHNIKIDNGGSLFTWSWNWSSFYWYKIKLENTNSATNAYLDVTRAVGMSRYKNKTKCKRKPTPYNIFVKKHYPILHKKYPFLNRGLIMRQCGIMWRTAKCEGVNAFEWDFYS